MNFYYKITIQNHIRIFFFVPIIGLILGCKTISVNNKQYQNTSTPIGLGEIIIDENFLFETTNTVLSSLSPEAPVRLRVSAVDFDKQTYQAYQHASKNHPGYVPIEYTDSLNKNPEYLNLQIIDRLTSIKSLNANPQTKHYLQDQADAVIVTGISLVLTTEDQTEFLNADEIFLESSGKNSLSISLYKKGEFMKSVGFNEMIVFGYRSSRPCWKENSKGRLQIVDLVDGDNKCPVDSYRFAKRARKNVDYFKF